MSTSKGLKGPELCRTLDIQPYVLRYWETEFKALQPSAGSGGQRTYSVADVALVRRIKQLLYEEGYTIAGAKKKLESEPLDVSAAHAPETAALFEPPPSSSRNEAAAAESGDGHAAGAPALDSASAERIKQVRRGVEKALTEAQSILRILDKHPR
jgi:DNA-binding transcriptional MerR regulator